MALHALHLGFEGVVIGQGRILAGQRLGFDYPIGPGSFALHVAQSQGQVLWLLAVVGIVVGPEPLGIREKGVADVVLLTGLVHYFLALELAAL